MRLQAEQQRQQERLAQQAACAVGRNSVDPGDTETTDRETDDLYHGSSLYVMWCI